MKKAAKAAVICGVVISSSSAITPPYKNPKHEWILTRGGTTTKPTGGGMENNGTSSSNNNASFDKGEKTSSSTSNNKKNDEKEKTSSTTEEKKETDSFLEDIVRKEDLYDILGIDKTSTKEQITKAYRKRAVRTHPDKTGGDRRAFDKVSEAYGVLSDDTKRQQYNRYGKKGLEQGGGGGGGGGMGGFRGASGAGSPEDFFRQSDLFRQFFGGQGQRGRQQFRQAPRTLRYQIEITLEDLYRGVTQNITVDTPDGRRKVVELHVPRGSIAGEAITLSGEIDSPSGAPGDLVFILQQSPHSQYTRKGHDVAIEMTITLEESIFGVKRDIYHLSGRRLCFQSAIEGEDSTGKATMIQTGNVQVLKGEGMPKRRGGGTIEEFGDLYIQYRVDMPKSTYPLSDEERVQLSTLLGKIQSKSSKINETTTKRKISKKAKISDFGRGAASARPRQQERRRRPNSSFFYQDGGAGFSNQFFGNSSPKQDDSNVECNQM